MTRTWGRGVVAVVAVGGLAIGLALWRWEERTTRSAEGRDSVVARAGGEPALVGPGAAPNRDVGNMPDGGGAGVPGGPMNAEARRRLREQIWRALESPIPEPTELAQGDGSVVYVLPKELPPPPPGEAGAIEPDYIQQIIRNKFWGRGRWCYEEARKRDPSLRGEVALGFTIVGDAKVGGIVEAIDVLDRSTLRDPGVIACIREYFLDNITFPPPEHGGYVQVVYPMVFAPPEEDEER